MHAYIHIPFCRQKCPYCKFALTPVFDNFKKARYLEYLKKEIREYFGEDIRNLNTLYFGGGTPSVLSIDEVEQILKCFPQYRRAREITFECNPEDINPSYVEGLISLGINRISLGVQTLNNNSLKEIHRSNRESILSALSNIQKVLEISQSKISINVDFILGLPNVKKGEILENIKELHSLFPFISHTSVYMLEDELYPKYWKGLSITEKEMQDDFLSILEYFEKKGWNHYELSNFSKPGYESFHNQAYWDHSNYRGFGLSAASYVDGRRFTNSASFSGYYAGKIIDEEVLTDTQIEIEMMMFGLRTNGISKEMLKGKGRRLIEEGLLEEKEGKILPTKTGIFLLDYIMGELV